MRGCWTTACHSSEVRAAGFSRTSSGRASLPTSWRRAAIRSRSSSRFRQAEAASHEDGERGDPGRGLAAVVGVGDERLDERPLGGGPCQPPDLDRAGAPLGRDGGPRDPGVLVRLLEEVDLVAAEGLRRVHRRVRVADERLDAQGAPDTDRHPDGDRDADGIGARDRVAGGEDQLAELLGDGRGGDDVRLGEDDHELLAPVAAQRVGRPDVGPQRRGHALEDDVAGLVAVRVVHVLEEVDVDEGDREGPVVAAGALDLGEEGGEDRRPVRDSRQLVRGRRVVRLGQRRGQAAQGGGQAASEPAAEGGDRGLGLAVRDPLDRLHERHDAGPQPEADDGGDDEDPDEHPAREAGCVAPRVVEPQAGQREGHQEHDTDRGEEPQRSKQADHGQQRTPRTVPRRVAEWYWDPVRIVMARGAPGAGRGGLPAILRRSPLPRAPRRPAPQESSHRPRSAPRSPDAPSGPANRRRAPPRRRKTGAVYPQVPGACAEGLFHCPRTARGSTEGARRCRRR